MPAQQVQSDLFFSSLACHDPCKEHLPAPDVGFDVGGNVFYDLFTDAVAFISFSFYEELPFVFHNQPCVMSAISPIRILNGIVLPESPYLSVVYLKI